MRETCPLLSAAFRSSAQLWQRFIVLRSPGLCFGWPSESATCAPSAGTSAGPMRTAFGSATHAGGRGEVRGARRLRVVAASVSRYQRAPKPQMQANPSPTLTPRPACTFSPQDRTVAVRLRWPLAGQACHLFAVFDGHGGSAASSYCAASVVAVVEALLSPAARPPATSPAVLASQLQEAVVLACLELHQAFAARGRSGGCTATLVLQAGRLVTVGSLGSSRCMLDVGAGSVAALSVEHVISSNGQERQRLAAAGCHVAPVDAAGSGPAPGPHSGSGVLRLWPGGQANNCIGVSCCIALSTRAGENHEAAGGLDAQAPLPAPLLLQAG